MEDLEPEDGIMEAEAFKDLPSVLNEQILQYCSVPDLCRLRSVSRAWNDLIHHSDFALRVRSQELFLFKATAAVDKHLRFESEEEMSNALRNGWELFDPRTQKFYFISMEFLKRERKLCLFDWCETVGADKGFVCVHWGLGSQEFMQVANLATGSVVEIPPSASNFTTRAMTVAEDYSSFTVYVAFMSLPQRSFVRGNSQRPFVKGDSHRPIYRFDSQVGEWQEFPLLQRPGLYTLSHLLKVNETLYMLFWDKIREKHQFFALDSACNEWTDTGVDLRCRLVITQLAMALGRLFYVGFLTQSVYTVKDVVVLEIDIASGECSVVTKLDKTDEADLLKLLDFYLEPHAAQSVFIHSIIHGIDTCTSVNIAVVGCGEFIVLTSCTGKSIAYDLLNNAWSKWRFDETLANHNEVSRSRHGLFAKAMTLTLNPVPAVALPKKLVSGNPTLCFTHA